MAGKKNDSIWLHFNKILIPGRKGCRAECKICKRTMQGLVARMKCHFELCSREENGEASSSGISGVSTTEQSDIRVDKKHKKSNIGLVTSTNGAQKRMLIYR